MSMGAKHTRQQQQHLLPTLAAAERGKEKGLAVVDGRNIRVGHVVAL